ncbi:MAG: ATP-binding protein [Deltaproteobacteria bacterium]|nr:ATP-binding protein [Deltaproteobacteria bacterium]
MVFLGGPRQVGKTILAFHLLGSTDTEHPAYLSWDDLSTRKLLLAGELPAQQKLLIFDEIHKYKHWRNFIKGIFDKQRSKLKILVTGSARLDYYRRGGDSLQGRYHYYRLHPLTLDEIGSAQKGSISQLLTYGGFPEPFLKADEIAYKRWQKERKSRVLQEDLISLEQVRNVSHVELLLDILPSRVSAPLSVSNLSNDLQVTFETAEKWIQILERLYFVYRIQPYGLTQLRAAKKERKLYLWDWSQCENEGARFENFVASHLLKYCHFIEDTQGEKMELRFLRDSMKREIDFVILKNNKPLFAVECKTGEGNLSPNISYFSSRTPIPKFYQVHLGNKNVELTEYKARLLPFQSFIKELWEEDLTH